MPEKEKKMGTGSSPDRRPAGGWQRPRRVGARRAGNRPQKAGRDKELIDELEGLHKEAKTTAKSRPTRAPPPIEIPVSIPDGEAPPSSPDLPLLSSSASLRRPPLPHRTISSSRFPAGSEISEVAVESKDEGSREATRARA